MAEHIFTGDGDELQVSASVGADTLIDGEADTAARPLQLPWLVERIGDSEYRFAEGAAASSDHYATAAQYRLRNASSTADDDLVDTMLGAAARYIDRRLGWVPGAFAPITSTPPYDSGPAAPNEHYAYETPKAPPGHYAPGPKSKSTTAAEAHPTTPGPPKPPHGSSHNPPSPWAAHTAASACGHRIASPANRSGRQTPAW